MRLPFCSADAIKAATCSLSGDGKHLIWGYAKTRQDGPLEGQRLPTCSTMLLLIITLVPSVRMPSSGGEIGGSEMERPATSPTGASSSCTHQALAPCSSAQMTVSAVLVLLDPQTHTALSTETKHLPQTERTWWVACNVPSDMKPPSAHRLST